MSRTYRQRRKRIQQARARRRQVLAVAVVGVVASMSAGGYGLYKKLKGPGPWPSIKTLEPERIGQNSIVYASDGSRMGVIQSDQNRTIIALDRMGEWAPKATVAIEDRRFYKHDGVDPEGISRAAVRDVKAGKMVEGGSTITQQVVRNLYQEITTERSIARKAKEATLARELEDVWNKEKILETYLNLVFYGHNAYGIEAAALTYFSRHAKSLSLPQAALLAGLPQKPSVFDPFNNPAQARDRRDKVLAAMLREKQITKAQYNEAVATPIKLRPSHIFKERRLPYFFDYVEQQLIEQYGAVTVRQGGLRIYTTISPRLQHLAERSIRDTLNYPGDPSAAMVVLDTKTGEIKAMASSEDWRTSKFNRAAQARRQPGSSAKIWVLAAFLLQGVDPESTYYTSRPFKVRYLGSSDWWEPKTYDNSYRGTISIASATIASDNSVYAQMTLDISPEEVSRTAHKLGVTSKLENVWSIGLGSQVVTPLEQTNFYSTIARGGLRIDPRAVRYLNGPGGGKIKLRYPKARRVMADWQAAEIVSILERNVQGGTGTRAAIGRKSAGKTGTTDDHKDAWYCGMTPELTSCVWMGYNIPTPMYSVHGISVAGGTFPAQIWHTFMSQALEGVKEHEWFTVLGTPMWIPFVSTWQDNPGFDVSVGAVAPPEEEEDDAKTDDDKKATDTTDSTETEETPATTPTTPTPPPVTPPGGGGGGVPGGGGGVPGGGGVGGGAGGATP